MAREDHQPREEAVERPERTREEMRGACGRTIAIVTAFGPKSETALEDVQAAIKAARRAQMPAAFVLASPDLVHVASEAVRTSVGHKAGTLVQAVEYDARSAVEFTRNAGDFELFNLPFGLLETARVLAGSVSDEYESVLIMDAAQSNITADHLYELCLDARERFDVEAANSWIQWLRRTPVLVKRDFLERLSEADYAQPAETGEAYRPVPRIGVLDHVFGEEKLAAPAPVPAAVESFLGKCTMSALQAVDLAKYAQEHPGEELRSPNQGLSLMGPAKLEPLNNADALLVKVAGEVLAAADADASRDVGEAAEFAWADTFGQRNKRDFPLLNDRKHANTLAYLDSAATTQRVDMALQAQRDFDEHENANVYRGSYELSAQATFSLNDARKRLEDFIGAERRQTVFTSNTTTATNLVALAWGEHNVGAGDTIVCELASHHSNMLPFAMLAERKGARIVHVPYDKTGRIDQAVYAAALELRPKLVCIAHIGNVFGIAAPVKEMTAAAHAAGARVLVDAAQSFPHLAIDVQDLGADWVALSGHKAYGPLGVGALWISPDAFDEMDPLGGGGGVVSHVSTESYYLKPKAVQYEMGTPPISQAIGLAAAVDYLDSLGMENVARHSAALTRYAVRGLQRIDGVNVVGDHSRPDGQTGLVSFTVRSVAPAGVGSFLGKLGVAIRSGGHCALPLHAALGMVGTGRISIGVHTTRADIDAALTAIALCRQAYEA